MAEITMASLRAELPAGITFDATAYPDATTAIRAASDVLDALLAAQIAQNEGAPAGQDVAVVTAGVGAETTLERDGVTHTVRPRIRTLSTLEKTTVSDFLSPNV